MRDGFTVKTKVPEYRDWIRSKRCASCQAEPPSEAHHLKGDLMASGMGMKAPDWLAMPLCRLCHLKMHEAHPGWREAQREALLRTLKDAFEVGIVGIIEP